MPSGRNDEERAVARARRLRKEMTLVEKVVWSRLSNSKTGFRFRRQFPFGPYVLDFYCATLRVAIEIDGPHHQFHVARDAVRDAWLRDRMVTTVRIPADKAYFHVDNAIDTIVEACRRASEKGEPT